MPSMALAQDRFEPTGTRRMRLEDARLLRGEGAYSADSLDVVSRHRGVMRAFQAHARIYAHVAAASASPAIGMPSKPARHGAVERHV